MKFIAPKDLQQRLIYFFRYAEFLELSLSIDPGTMFAFIQTFMRLVLHHLRLGLFLFYSALCIALHSLIFAATVCGG